MPAALITEASKPYLRAGPGWFAYFFARGKLRADPAYRAIVELGLLSGREEILDLGCGQGLLASWLQSAVACYDRGLWPSDWPAPPRPRTVRGIELKASDVKRARHAFGAKSAVSQGDIRNVAFGRADAIVILDVLHYLKADAQRQVIERVRAALPPRGTLLLRVCDAEAGMRFRYTQWVDKIVMFARGHAFVAAHSRSIPQWRALLSECGFDSDAAPMSAGTPFANVLLIAYAR